MIHNIVASARSIAGISRQAIAAHPRRVTAAVALVLLGAGGYATASLAPDVTELPVRQIIEVVAPLPLQTQADSLQERAFSLYRSDTTRSTDSAESLLKRLGVDDASAAAFLRSTSLVRQNLLGRGGRNVSVEANADNTLLRLTARWSPDDNGNFKRLVVAKTQTGFTAEVQSVPMTASSRLASGTIQTSLFAATDDARIPDGVAVQVAEIFAGDIDFHRALRKGDRFSVVYETLEGDGEPLRSGRVLSAEFVNNGKTYQAMWFRDPTSASATQVLSSQTRGGYYTLDGQSLRRSFLASPMEFSRVTSGFKMRFHPILQKWRAHLGVDYAAPTGTPVRSVGDGVVEFAGVQNGFGNVVFVSHRNNHSTVYAHLSRIDVQKGQLVNQSQLLGAVGATGWTTGPHLHFEFRVNGVHHDPLTIAKQSEAVPVSAEIKPLFDRVAAGNRQLLQAAATAQQVSTQ